jgi:hypothetical protein
VAPDQWFNFTEALLWASIGIVLLVRSPRSGGSRRRALCAGIVFLLFGISDVIEMRTRAWYEPVALLLFKAACVAALVAVWVVHRQARSRKP